MSSAYPHATLPKAPWEMTPTVAVAMMAASEVAVAIFVSNRHNITRRGTMTRPPPTPKRVLKSPATKPIPIRRMVSAPAGRVLASALMEPPSAPWDELLAHARATPGQTALLFDLDGTLAPIVDHPADVAIPDDVRGHLVRLTDQFGLVAFISGRRRDELAEVVGMTNVAYSGNHGHELRDRDGSDVAVGHDGDLTLSGVLQNLPHDKFRALGVWIEDKGPTATLHYRGAPDPERARRYLEQEIRPIAMRAGLRVAAGRMSLELHPDRTVNKGTAVHALLGRHPNMRHVVSFGDDLTDVAVWKMLHAAVARGELVSGVAIGVASDETPPEVAEAADVMVAGIDGVDAILTALSR